MNIGFIEDTPLRGGTQIWVTEAARFLIEQGEDVTIIAPAGSYVAEECEAAGARAAAYDYDGVVGRDAESRAIWTRGLEGCDVAVCTVHPPREGFHCSVFGAECIKAAGLDTVLIPKTGTIVPEYKREFYLPDPSIRSTVIAITGFTYRYLVDTYEIPEDIVELIYQGTEVSRFTPDPANKPEACRRYPLPGNAGPVLGCVGAFEERKGQIVLLEAVASLAAGPLPNVHLLLVGEGPDEAMLREKVESMGLSQNVSIFPFTREPSYVFERIDILVLSSLFKEGLPNVLLEAMSMKTPVVSSRMAGVPEIVKDGETGYMVEPGDAGQLADAIAKLWSDSAVYEAMCENGRALMEARFDKDTQFSSFLSYFQLVGVSAGDTGE